MRNTTIFPLAPNGVYKTLQGEGGRVGSQATFVRLAACGVECRLCDTDYTRGDQVTLDFLVSAIKNLGQAEVVITGGEPILEKGSRQKSLVSLIQKLDVPVTIETSLTAKPISDLLDLPIYWSIAPKLKGVGLLPKKETNPSTFFGMRTHIANTGRGWVKLVVSALSKEKVTEELNTYLKVLWPDLLIKDLETDIPIYVQPVHEAEAMGSESSTSFLKGYLEAAKAVSEAILDGDFKLPSPLRLSLQTHKLLRLP